jgi:hypothetical protein
VTGFGPDYGFGSVQSERAREQRQPLETLAFSLA